MGDTVDYESNLSQRGGMVRKLLAVLLAALAGRLALALVERLWVKGLRREVPAGIDESKLEMAAWIGLTAAAVGIARELVRQSISPPVRTAA